MPNHLTRADRAELEAIVRRLEAAWVAPDGSAFAESFAPDADFVNVRGEYFRGRLAIASRHAAILQTIYAGISNRLTIEAIRLLSQEVALVRVQSTLDAPEGPRAGRHRARFSLVLTKGSLGWEIASLHNTLETAQGPPPGRATS